MATIDFRMQAPGLKTPGSAESCAGYERDLSKGEMMAATKADNRERVSWLCQACVEKWKRTGEARLPDGDDQA